MTTKSISLTVCSFFLFSTLCHADRVADETTIHLGPGSEPDVIEEISLPVPEHESEPGRPSQPKSSKVQDEQPELAHETDITLSKAANTDDQTENQGSASYPKQTATKFATGVANIATSWVEIPKTMIKISKDEGVAMGLTGGLFKGVANTVGRVFSGTVDVITAPINLESDHQEKKMVWEEFDMESSAGKAFESSPPDKNQPAVGSSE